MYRPRPTAAPLPGSPGASGIHRPVLRFDGAAKGNPGRASAAFAIWAPDGNLLADGAFAFPDRMTNNQAEYMGLIAGLRCARKLGLTGVDVEGDSNLVIEHLFGTYKVRSANLAAYHQEASRCRAALADGVMGRWIPRERNGHADALCNAVLRPGASSRHSECFERPTGRIDVLQQLAAAARAAATEPKK
jgi:ribonuclease HI